MDFGLARRLDADPRLTTTGAIIGSPRLHESRAGRRPPRGHAQRRIQHLGVILYELVTGHPPRDMGGSQYDVLKRIAEEDVRPPAKVGVRLERGWRPSCSSAWPNPEARYGSAGDLARELCNYLAGRPLIARPPTRLEQLGRGVRRHAAALATAAAVMAVLAAVLTQSAYGAVRRERDIARTRRGRRISCSPAASSPRQTPAGSPTTTRRPRRDSARRPAC